jgi:catalase
MEAWERDELVAVLTAMIGEAAPHVQERMVWHFLLVDEDYGLQVADGLGVSPSDVASLKPLATQTLGETDLARLARLPHPGKRELSTTHVTGSVPVGQGLPTSAGARS